MVMSVMFFFRNKHMMIDLGTGNNNKINWAVEDKQEMIDIIETVYRGARKGRGLVISPKDYSTKYRYVSRFLIVCVGGSFFARVIFPLDVLFALINLRMVPRSSASILFLPQF